MNFLGYPQEPEKALLFIDVLDQMRIPPQGWQIDSIMQAAIPKPIMSTFVEGADDCPAFALVGIEGKLFIFITGTETLAQGVGFWNGALGSSFTAAGSSSNSYLINAAAKIKRVLNNGTIPQNVPTWTVGYSMGGAIAQVYARQYVVPGNNLVSFGVTFGSPRAMFGADSRLLTHGEYIRWMVDTDPVPLLPPSFTEAPSVLLLYGLRAQRQLNLYCHTTGGLQIDQQSIITEQIVPENAVFSVSGSVGAWLFGEDTLFGPGHSLATYRTRFANLVAGPRRPSHRLPAGAGVEPTTHLDNREANQQMRRTTQALYRQGEVQNANAITAPPNTFLVAFREGNIWSVALGDQVVAVGPGRRRAQALARFGNQFLRRLLRQAVVPSDQLIVQMQAFLATAADPTSAIKPTLQTEFPSA